MAKKKSPHISTGKQNNKKEVKKIQGTKSKKLRNSDNQTLSLRFDGYYTAKLRCIKQEKLYFQISFSNPMVVTNGEKKTNIFSTNEKIR